MNKSTRLLCALLAAGAVIGVLPSSGAAGGGSPLLTVTGYSPVDFITLAPGDSRSLEFEYNGTLGEPESFHCAFIAVTLPDDEIHQLTITVAPKGGGSSEIGYFTGGVFGNLTQNSRRFELLEPKFTYGYKHVTYTVNINPTMALGFVLSAALVEYEHFDFPLEMTMILTLSN